MFKNYFTIAVRNIWRNKTFSAINILGLAIGISASLVIYLIVDYDFNFDKFEKNGDRIYRVVSHFTFPGESFKSSGVPSPMGAAVKSEVTGLELTAPFRTWNDNVKVSVPVANNEQPTIFKKQTHLVFADENYFKLLQYDWQAGSAKTSLQQPYQVVLTASNAALYFPKLKPAEIIGKELIFNDTVHTTVTGIVADLQENTDFTFKTFVSGATLESTTLKPEDWGEWNSTTSATQVFVQLSPGANTQKIITQINTIATKNRKVEPGDHSTTTYNLQPLSDIHFNPDYDNFDQRLAHKPTLYALFAVAAFLLVLGCINFINLTTAHASQRAKEIGVRKTLGSSKNQLIFQFLSETFLITSIATLLSVGLTPLLLKVFANYIPEGLHLSFTEHPGLVLFLLALTLFVSLLSGFYPALILSSYKPVAVLKNQALTNSGKANKAVLRKTLTVSQFVIAQVFIIATLLVSKQISFSLNHDMGFKKEAIVNFSINYYDTSKTKKLALLNKLNSIPGIQMISLSNNPPSSNNTWSSTMKYKDGKKEIETDVHVKLGDTNYIKLYHIKLLAGTDLPFSDTIHNLLINETYAYRLGFKDPQQAIGKLIEWNHKHDPIVGVVSNFNQKSFHEPIKPLIISSAGENSRTFSVLLQPQNVEGTLWKTTIGKIEKEFKQMYPDDDFEYTFFDESIAKFYTAEQNISRLLKWATGLAIFISCLGLSGLVMYITSQRTKEIGIRKVVGATVGQIVSLLSKDFLKLIIVAFVIAVPIAWYGANEWLKNFEFKTGLSWWIFGAGGLFMLLMAFIVLSMRTFKAANANPVKSLRTE